MLDDDAQPSAQIDQVFEVKTYDIEGVSVQVREFAFSVTNSGTVWKSSFPLCKYIMQHEAQFRGKRIIELGSGTGIVSIFLKKQGFDITSSDIADDEVTENIQHNYRLNGVEVPHVPHLWGTDFPPELNNFDVVIASDIILYVNHYDELLVTLKQLMMKHPDQSLCVMTYKRKASNQNGFFALLNQQGFEHEVVGSKIWKFYPKRRPLMTWAADHQGPLLSTHPFAGPEAGGHGSGPGIIAHLRSTPKEAAEIDLVVTASEMAVGSPDDFIAEGSRCWTSNRPYSWYCVDFGPDRKVIPSHYSMTYGSRGGTCSPRFWIFQASDGFNPDRKYGTSGGDTPGQDPDWQTLAVHNNDTSLGPGLRPFTWKVTSRQAYRYLRVVQIGPNAFEPTAAEDVWSQVFVVNGFEVYGALLRAPFVDVPHMPPIAAPPVYSNSEAAAPRTQSAIIRASPEVSKELHEALAHLVRRESDPPEKVRVVDIGLSGD
eukprot:TRINITY_DN22769_c0_g1_i1.p1 TRINITY_DN22769_c0_g1~~TRINITY_DN22769_c0_g1_i1.p1  ORF type:complete len:543 (-),score=131.01 TRINITY_DN22769_c0_g1_i1:202-1656(-)